MGKSQRFIGGLRNVGFKSGMWRPGWTSGRRRATSGFAVGFTISWVPKPSDTLMGVPAAIFSYSWKEHSNQFLRDWDHRISTLPRLM